MNTLPDEVKGKSKEEILKYCEEFYGNKSIVKAALKAMDIYALAYAPVPSNEDYEGAGKILYPLELQEIILDYRAWLESMIPHVKKSIQSQINEKIKSLEKYQFAATVPGKEEGYWQRRCEAAELVIGISGIVDCEGYEQWETLKEQEPASPSTASNEDKLTAQEYQKLIQGDFDKSYDEPKAVQQAAKEWADKKYGDHEDAIGHIDGVKDFLAGASFNSNKNEDEDE